MIVDTVVATVVTILQLLQHIVSLKSGAFIAHCRLITVSKPRYALYPSQTTRRLPITRHDHDDDDVDLEGKTTHTHTSIGRTIDSLSEQLC